MDKEHTFEKREIGMINIWKHVHLHDKSDVT